MDYAQGGSGPLTVREYAALPDEDYGDLVEGRLVREPRPNTWHSLVTLALARELDAWVRQRGLGLVLPEAGFLLDDEPATVRGPDVAFVARARIPEEGMPEGFWPGAPDLAIEVASRSNRVLLPSKVADYLEAGARLVWVVEPSTRVVVVHRPDHAPSRLEDGDTLTAEPVLPGFRLPVTRLFEDLPPAA